MIWRKSMGTATLREIGQIRSAKRRWAFTSLMTILALSGWGAFAYNAHSSNAARNHVYQLVAELTAGQLQLLAERNEAMAQLTATRKTAAALGPRLESVTAERDNLKVQLAARQEMQHLVEAKAKETGTIRTPRPSGKPAPTPGLLRH
jgi:hypothetical protein